MAGKYTCELTDPVTKEVMPCRSGHSTLIQAEKCLRALAWFVAKGQPTPNLRGCILRDKTTVRAFCYSTVQTSRGRAARWVPTETEQSPAPRP